MKFIARKIMNDPVYGIINLPDGILFDLISHPYVQRLRRISQLGLSNYVYPGANHSRFHHAIGALHLCQETLEVFGRRGLDVSVEEAEGLGIALLCHDLGHGPFSHVLEHVLTSISHETLTLAIMERLNVEFDGKLDLAIQIFTGTYKKQYLHQLVSGQLDLDRMDYLNRDSFFTGVAEGKIGYDRIIKMLTIYNDQLAVEEKGIYSVEKFLMARRLMYWQVYLHKTVLATEQMLIAAMKRAKELSGIGIKYNISPALQFFLDTHHAFEDSSETIIQNFLELDDYDIWWALKQFSQSEYTTLRILASYLLDRKIFKAELSKTPFSTELIAEKISFTAKSLGLNEKEASRLVITGYESNEMYYKGNDEIMILMKTGDLRKFSEISDYPIANVLVKKYFLAFPKQNIS